MTFEIGKEYKILGWCNATYIGQSNGLFEFRRTDKICIYSLNADELTQVEEWHLYADNESKRSARIFHLGPSLAAKCPDEVI